MRWPFPLEKIALHGKRPLEPCAGEVIENKSYNHKTEGRGIRQVANLHRVLRRPDHAEVFFYALGNLELVIQRVILNFL